MTHEELIQMAKDRNDLELLALLQGTTPPTAVKLKEHQSFMQQRDFLLQLIQARHAAKLTQVELAEKTGISQSSLARIETGRVHQNLKTLLKLCDNLNLQLTVQPSSD